MPTLQPLASRFYALLAEDEDARVCRDIPDAACNEQPAAFTLQLIALTLTKIGDSLTSSRLVLAWLLTSLSAPAIFIALLVPLRESLSLLPQLIIAARIRAHALRKPFWSWGSVIQGLCLIGMLPAVLFLEGAAAGWVIISLLVGLSLARGVCSVASKDVLGKTVSKSRRGRLNGLAASTAGLVTLGVAGTLILAAGVGGDIPNSRWLFVLMLASAAMAALAAAWVYAQVPEVPGATGGGGNAATEALNSVSLLWRDADFRNFVIARALLVATAFAIPYVVILINEAAGGSALTFAVLLLAEGIAGLCAAPVWGFWSDRASHHVMAAGAVISIVAVGAAVALQRAAPELLSSLPVGAALLLFCAIAHQGVRIGRKTYLVDLATADTRAAMTAVSNTVLGIFMLAGGMLAWVDSRYDATGVLVLLMVFAAAGALRSVSLRRVD